HKADGHQATYDAPFDDSHCRFPPTNTWFLILTREAKCNASKGDKIDNSPRILTTRHRRYIATVSRARCSAIRHTDRLMQVAVGRGDADISIATSCCGSGKRYFTCSFGQHWTAFQLDPSQTSMVTMPGVS